MKILLLDTSTQHLSIALERDGKVISLMHDRLDKPFDEALIPILDLFLRNNDLRIEDIDVFVVGHGPGSFTSLRVGIATIKGLVFVVKKPVIAISSLYAVAMNMKESSCTIGVMIDARRQLVYSCFFKRNEKGLQRISDYMLISCDDLLKKTPKDTIFVGDACEIYAQKLKENGLLFSSKEENKYVRAENFLAEALIRIENNQFDDIDNLDVLYLYPDDCQVNR